MLQLLLILAVSIASAALALRLARWWGLAHLCLRERLESDGAVRAFVDELVDAAAGRPVGTAAVQEALLIARSAPSPSAAREALEERFDRMLEGAGLQERGRGLAERLPLIALGALLLGFVGLLTGGILPARLVGLAGAGLVVMLLGSVMVLVKGWVGTPARMEVSHLILRHALLVEAASCIRAGLPAPIVRARLLAMAPELAMAIAPTVSAKAA